MPRLLVVVWQVRQGRRRCGAWENESPAAAAGVVRLVVGGAAGGGSSVGGPSPSERGRCSAGPTSGGAAGVAGTTPEMRRSAPLVSNGSGGRTTDFERSRTAL